MEREKQQTKSDMKKYSLSKSRFKKVIDQIQKRIRQSKYPSLHQDQVFYKSKVKKIFPAQQNYSSRVLPLFIQHFVPLNSNASQEKKISINLEFNKLLTSEKRSFVQHKPNDKDLMIGLPELKVPMKTISDYNIVDPREKFTNRWRLNPMKLQKIMTLTQCSQLEMSKNQRKYSRMSKQAINKRKQYKKKILDKIEDDSLVYNKQNKSICQQNNSIRYSKYRDKISLPPGRFSHNCQRKNIKRSKKKLQTLSSQFKTKTQEVKSIRSVFQQIKNELQIRKSHFKSK